MNSMPSFGQMFDNPDVVAAIMFCIAATFGQFAHALKKWADGTTECVMDQFSTGIRSTISSMIANSFGMILFIQTGVLSDMYAAKNGWWAIILFGLMNGFSADSALNKSVKRAVENK